MPEADIAVFAVAGAGFMGSGIAEAVARAGVQVRVYEPQEEPLAASRERIEQSVARAVRGGRLDASDGGELVERIVWTSDLADLADADVVVEAVVEDLDVKRDLFARLDATVPHARILASNTSSIPVA